MEDILYKYSPLNRLNVSRETCLDFESLISMIIKKNSEINIISKKTSKNSIIRERHIIDSAQAIEFVDLNTSSLITSVFKFNFLDTSFKNSLL